MMASAGYDSRGKVVAHCHHQCHYQFKGLNDALPGEKATILAYSVDILRVQDFVIFLKSLFLPGMFCR